MGVLTIQTIDKVGIPTYSKYMQERWRKGEVTYLKIDGMIMNTRSVDTFGGLEEHHT